MSTDQARRPGRKTETLDLASYNLTLERETADWGKGQPGGLSETVRRLLRREYDATRGTALVSVGENLFADPTFSRLAQSYARTPPMQRYALLQVAETMVEVRQEERVAIEALNKQRDEIASRLAFAEKERQVVVLRLETEQIERGRLVRENERLLARLNAGVPKLAPT